VFHTDGTANLYIGKFTLSRCASRLISHREGLISVSNIKSGKDKKEVYAKKKQEQAHVTQRESIAFSILYNNALFLFCVVVLGFFVFKSASAPLYAPPPNQIRHLA
jgi:hypothetical protein